MTRKRLFLQRRHGALCLSEEAPLGFGAEQTNSLLLIDYSDTAWLEQSVEVQQNVDVQVHPSCEHDWYSTKFYSKAALAARRSCVDRVLPATRDNLQTALSTKLSTCSHSYRCGRINIYLIRSVQETKPTSKGRR